MSASPDHPLADALIAASDGRFPPVDGVVEVVPPDGAGTCAVVEFTGHSFVLTGRSAADPLFAAVDAFGGATDPRLLVQLAGPSGWIGSLDLVMARRAGPGEVTALPAAVGFGDHPRVRRARDHRRDLRVFGDERGVVCIGRGLVDRTEIAIEVDAARGSGHGRELVVAAMANLSDGELVFAQVAPGNAASVRMFLACGFAPIGSEVLIDPGHGAV
jgi:RimJ/RimL family protein N-acetyltransferase